MRPARLSLALLLAAVAGGALGCAAAAELFREPEDAVVPFTRPDPLYEELVPHYAELCAVSQYRPLKGRVGGIPGHAVMYLKGVCKDESAPYPRLRRCRRAAVDIADPEHGAGVSVNRYFQNVNWVATPGKYFFYSGDVRTYEPLDQALVVCKGGSKGGKTNEARSFVEFVSSEPGRTIMRRYGFLLPGEVVAH